MKTITELNSKWWYRLIKVAYLGLALIIVIFATYLTFDSYKPRPVTDYKINCLADYTNKKTFFATKDADLYLYQGSEKTIYASLSDSERSKLRELCDLSDAEAKEATNKVLDYVYDPKNKNATDEDVARYADTIRPYTISLATRIEGTYLETLGYAILPILIALIVTEILRRAFYYIFLGTLKPSK